MIPGQRGSRRSQALENYAMGVGDVANDDSDDFGLPNKNKSATNAKKPGLFNRFKRGPAKSTDVNDSDDDEGSFDVIPGFTSPTASMPHLPNMSNNVSRPSFTPNLVGSGTPHSAAFPPNLNAFPPNLNALPPHSGAPYRGSSASDAGSLHNVPRSTEDDISFDQISSLRDRHRYPAMSDDNKGRTMSLTSMSSYDTRPIIPLMTTHPNSSKSTSQPDSYRHRMVETRRALLGPDAGLIAPTSPALPPQSADRKMSLSSVRSATSRPNAHLAGSMGPLSMGPNGGTAPLAKQNGGNLTNFPANKNRAQMSPSAMYGNPPFNSQPGSQSPYALGSPSYGSPSYGAPNYGAPNYGAPNHAPPNHAPPNHAPRGMMGPPQHAMGIPANLPRFNGPGNGHFPELSGPVESRSLRGSNPTAANPIMFNAPPPRLDHTANPAMHSVEDFGLPQLGPQSPVPLQPQPNEAGAALPTQASESTNGVKLKQDFAAVSRAGAEQIQTLEDEVRILSIELAESARRELKLNPSSEHINLVMALATAHSELALERKKRESLERIVYNGGGSDPQLPQKLADLEYHHSEAVHLLAIRSQQYERVVQEKSGLQTALDEKTTELADALAKTHNTEQHQHIFDHNKRLTQQVETLEHENQQLKSELARESQKESSNDRITALEDQRSALQEAMRAMRQRKDAEIHHLNARIEALSLNQQRSRAASSSARLNDDISPHKPPSLTSGSPVRSMSSDDESSLVMPRLRDPGIRRPASPLHIGLDYSR